MPALWARLSEDMFARMAAQPEASTEALSNDSLQVMCAWPLSGQYGTGSRVLYYVLVTACIVARKYEWLRDACLAAVLLLPAVAALHGIVLAALHREGAVDMDMYGAFQLCAIGILAAPVTVRLSQTYFDRPGRNAIFLWTGIIVAGLTSLTVEFYRADPQPCNQSGSFEYGTDRQCGLDCSSLHSPLRTGSVDDIYVLPEPQILTFGTATLLNAALCVHAVLWMLSMLDKILAESSNKYRKGTRPTGGDNEPIQGTNGATRSRMESINDMVKRCLSVAVVPIFMAAGLAILIIGERNFFSRQMSYKTEPIESVGQWAPIAAASLAVIGSLYLLLAKDIDGLEKEKYLNACSCPHCHAYSQGHAEHRQASRSSETASQRGSEFYRTRSSQSLRRSSPSSNEHREGLTRIASDAMTLDAGKRRTVAQAFVTASRAMGMAASVWTDDSDFQRGRAQDWPEIPGELNRNRNLSQIRTQYNKPRDEDGNVTPAGPSRSRASSFVSSDRPRVDDDSPARGAATRPTLSILTANASGGVRTTRKPRSMTTTSDEAHVELREYSQSHDSLGHRLGSPDHLEVPRSAFLPTRSAFGDQHYDTG